MKAFGFCLLLLSVALPVSAFDVLGSRTLASNGSIKDTQAAASFAADGSVILLPSGEFEWTKALVLTKSVTLQGEGIGRTILRCNVTNSSLISITLASAGNTRITGIEFIASSSTYKNTQHGTVYVRGRNTDPSRGIIDNCRFVNVPHRAGVFVSGALGVTHSCTFVLHGQFAVDIRHENWNGRSYGDGSWADDPHFGTDRFWFIEDCTMEQAGQLFEGIDSYGGARWVMRHNKLINSRFATHGTESTQRMRGTRAVELYDNEITGDKVNSEALTLRSGVAVVFNNVFSNWNTAFAGIFSLKAYRATDSVSPWGGGDGANQWDRNDPANPIASGTVTAGGDLTMTDTIANWRTNQWVGYTLHNITQRRFSQIVSNTRDTIKLRGSIFNGSMSTSAGDKYVINRVIAILDQPGAGKCDLINLNLPQWPNQAIEPCYEWNNTANGKDVGFGSSYAVVQRDKHYFNNTRLSGYVPFAFPHPLREAPPAPPQDVRVIAQ
jgi:hypothetical protein